MSWNQTKRRWAALHEIETLANAGCTELPWNAEYVEIFGDRDELAAALRYRWNLTLSAQLDDHLSDDAVVEHRRLLEERNAGVLRMLASHQQGGRVPAPLSVAQRNVPNERISA